MLMILFTLMFYVFASCCHFVHLNVRCRPNSSEAFQIYKQEISDKYLDVPLDLI